MRRNGQSGQAATEYMLLVSVVVVGLVAGSYTFVPTFQQGVHDLGRDVQSILGTGKIGDIGSSRKAGGAAVPVGVPALRPSSAPNTAPLRTLPQDLRDAGGVCRGNNCPGNTPVLLRDLMRDNPQST